MRTSWLFSILYRKTAEARRKAGREQATEDIDAIFEKRFDASGSWIQPPLSVDSERYASGACVLTVKNRLSRLGTRYIVFAKMLPGAGNLIAAAAGLAGFA